MSLDLWLEARIKEKSTNKIVSVITSDNEGFFEICYWCGYEDERNLRGGMIEIVNRCGGTNYTSEDVVISVPENALRGLYEYLVERSCVSPDDEVGELRVESKWIAQSDYEHQNLLMAVELHNLIFNLRYIKEYNKLYINFWNKFVIDDYKEKIEKNPQAFEWEFRLVNSD